MTVMQGPFQLKQGGYGIAVRNPVYLDQKDGQETFWGFTIVIIRVPDIFADSVKHFRILAISTSFQRLFLRERCPTNMSMVPGKS